MTLVIVGFVVIFAVILVSVSVAMKFYEARRKKHVTDILQTVAGPSVTTTTRLLKDLEAPEPTTLERLLQQFDVVRRTQEQIQQSGLDWTPRKLVINMAVAAAPGLVLGFLVPEALGRPLSVVTLATLSASLPYFYLRTKRRKRLALLEEQLPEALDFLSRSMRAGHAFAISLEMLGEELPDPLGQEVRTMFNEHNLGAPLDVALRNFSERVPLFDVRFFCSAVLLQRQTGGNLSEILTRLAYLIRERFRLRGQVKAASAHGRMTAGVLAVLPIAAVIGLMMISPGYLRGMAKDPDGRSLIIGAIVAQFVGNYCIKKIVNIKV